MQGTSRHRVIPLAAALGLMLVSCTSGAANLLDSTPTVTDGSEHRDPTTTPHEEVPPRLSDGTTEQVGLESSSATSAAGDPNELVGMRAYTGWGAGPALGYEGILLIEYPCAYLYLRDNRELLYSHQDSETPAFGSSTTLTGKRALLSLVEDWTDYDPETNTLRFRELHYIAETDSYRIGDEDSSEDPIASGDRVELAGLSHDRPIQGHEDVCQRDFDITVDGMALCKLHACRIEREAR